MNTIEIAKKVKKISLKKALKIAIRGALGAGKAIEEIYELKDFQISSKSDDSPLTIADKKANNIINNVLRPSGIPIISEENKQIDYEIRKNWDTCWIVDPLDGTKEFIKRNGEFTVNIALVKNGNPVLGVIFAPALKMLYFADVSQGKAYKVPVSGGSEMEKILSEVTEMKPDIPNTTIKVVGSRSHMNDATTQFIEELEKEYEGGVEVVSKGSSLKFCLVAEGQAHVYPRFAPTMEWDTAAGQAICEAVGLEVTSRETGESITYNRTNMLNPHFLVSSGR